MLEFDAGAEAELDVRLTRRLLDLELGDVVVPPAPEQTETVLFFRVLGDDGGRIRIELWERGEQNGVRVVSAIEGGRNLGARRVALAAAELARRLRTKRLRTQAAVVRLRQQRADAERRERQRTLDGAVALAAGFSGEYFPGENTYLVGPALALELSTPPFGRLDFGLGLRGGELGATARGLETLEFELDFARRMPLTKGWDLELAAGLRAGLLSLSGVSEVDAMPGESQSWWSRALAAGRLQPRLSRDVRVNLGLELGTVLREVPLRDESGERARVTGVFVGAELGLVLTPPAKR